MLRKKLSLNGEWLLQPSDDDPIPTVWNHRVSVPALVDIAQPYYDWKAFTFHWYRTTFKVGSKNDLAFVVIEQAMFGTDIWLNGAHLGGDIACYTSQEYDARSALKLGENTLVVRVGQRQNLPAYSAAGNDQERTEWIPGIWGDVSLIQSGNPRIKLVQVIPDIKNSTAEVRVTIENLAEKSTRTTLSTLVREKATRKQVSNTLNEEINLAPSESKVVESAHPIAEMHLWSPDSPFLYECELQTLDDEGNGDARTATFGMREFNIVGGDVHLNGKKIYLRGGNIAFHRFLSDADRGTLPWNVDWVKKLLIDIPKEHHFNFFRNHIGQMYNRWYDIADEYGMLLQNEWMFWTTTGSKEQIANEFTRWLQDNWNHPSIILWDALNECSDDIVQKEIVPQMKLLDPTRPWESVDFVEEHPYIYSLGPVLNDRKFGFARSLQEIETSLQPTMLNEFCWWWLDKENNPSSLTQEVVERWLGPDWTKEQLIEHQSFLVTELVELFRRMRVDAIQPFVYLSNNAGPTANWFLGDIKNLEPKPILKSIKNVFAPFGVSIELWDRHFFPGEHRTVRVFVFNDNAKRKEGKICTGISNSEGKWIVETEQSISVEAGCSTIIPISVVMPPQSGDYRVRCELWEAGKLVAQSGKLAYVLASAAIGASLRDKPLAFLSRDNELPDFLAQNGIATIALKEGKLNENSLLVVGEGMLMSNEYQARIGAVTKFLKAGGSVVVIEPEYGIEEPEQILVALDVELAVVKRNDVDKGGYDSYIFAHDISHPMWQGIAPDHLKMFNGGYGGEAVSEHTVTPNYDALIHARCGLKLRINAIFEIPVGKGKVVVSRLQSRGRLVDTSNSRDLFARRRDPVLQRHLLNMLSYAAQ